MWLVPTNEMLAEVSVYLLGEGCGKYAATYVSPGHSEHGALYTDGRPPHPRQQGLPSHCLGTAALGSCSDSQRPWPK